MVGSMIHTRATTYCGKRCVDILTNDSASCRRTFLSYLFFTLFQAQRLCAKETRSGTVVVHCCSTLQRRLEACSSFPRLARACASLSRLVPLSLFLYRDSTAVSRSFSLSRTCESTKLICVHV